MQEFEALAMTGATTIVAAMATDAWTTVRDRAAALFRGRTSDLARIEAQLDANSAQVAGSQNTERSRTALVGGWQMELEELLSAHPEAAADLRAQAAVMQAAMSSAQQQWIQQHNTARDNAVINAVQQGNQHNYYMDSPRSLPPVAPSPDEGLG
jgi:hypothetical protein